MTKDFLLFFLQEPTVSVYDLWPPTPLIHYRSSLFLKSHLLFLHNFIARQRHHYPLPTVQEGHPCLQNAVKHIFSFSVSSTSCNFLLFFSSVCRFFFYLFSSSCNFLLFFSFVCLLFFLIISFMDMQAPDEILQVRCAHEVI